MNRKKQYTGHSFVGAVFTGVILLLVSNVSAQNLFVSDGHGNNIYEFTTNGVQSTFASGLYVTYGMAIQGGPLPVPEPSVFGLLGLGAAAFLVRYRWHPEKVTPKSSPKVSPEGQLVGSNGAIRSVGRAVEKTA